jgi:hypothetical protein
MSTSPETSPKASLSSNCAVQTRRLARRGEKVLAIVAAFVVAAGLGLVVKAKLLHVPSPAAREAMRLGRTYADAQPGETVVWCVDHTSLDVSFVDGRASDSVIWTNPGAAPLTSPPKSGHCEKMVGRVVERRPNGVVLEYLGRP